MQFFIVCQTRDTYLNTQIISLLSVLDFRQNWISFYRMRFQYRTRNWLWTISFCISVENMFDNFVKSIINQRFWLNSLKRKEFRSRISIETREYHTSDAVREGIIKWDFFLNTVEFHFYSAHNRFISSPLHQLVSVSHPSNCLYFSGYWQSFCTVYILVLDRVFYITATSCR